MSNKARRTAKEVFSGDEVSLIDLFYLFWTKKRLVLISTIVFFIIGAIIAITSPLEYQSSSRILLESSGKSSSMGDLRGLAGLAGISIPSAQPGSDLSIELYPEIISSQPFLMELMQQRFYFQETNQEMSLYEYFSVRTSGHLFSSVFRFVTGLPGKFFNLFQTTKKWEPLAADKTIDNKEEEKVENIVVRLSAKEMAVMKVLSSRLMIEAEEGRIVTLNVKMPEPQVSAELNNIVKNEIIKYITAYKTEKERENLKFINERFIEADQKFQEAQFRLASFRDSNIGITTEMSRSEEERYIAEYDLAYSIYTSLAQQLEQTKIQLKKDTPLFSDFEPVTVPLSNIEPNVPLIIIMSIILGMVVGFMLVIGQIIRDYAR